MNHKLQEEIGFLADTLSKWKPNMSISGLLDFHQNIGTKTQLIAVYKKATLELRANRYDGLANTLEALFEAFQKDVTERETKRFGKDKEQSVFDQLLSNYKITKPVHTRSSDIYLAFMHIEMSKQHLIDVLKKIAQLPETIDKQNGGKIIKLTDFMRDYCEKPLSVESKANRIHTFVKNGKIKCMPKPVNETKGNETKLYKVDDLKKIWPNLQQIIKSLPNIKD